MKPRNFASALVRNLFGRDVFKGPLTDHPPNEKPKRLDSVCKARRSDIRGWRASETAR